ncbi:DEAD/DEAH box helicase family protein [Metabacillus litoralis]|uniref:DEAD/DEAH box helicase family protein n=1 Tax=Metabacillus TaxID=2675233 RepID=UPI001B95A8A5|nr:DEAD/DEAH box helicase family protein [Metabacillus litoralis]UHA58857.1 DEAD/DEAH box helicase family protein [Metabacillus litoralis]
MSKVELITDQLISHLLEKIEHASTICILTSFVMKSGVELLREPLKRAAERGVDIKLCTGDYLYITQPEALKALVEIHSTIEVRLWNSNGVSFHPKAYLFHLNEEGHLVIGSSNLSRSALTSGIEWNVSIDKDPDVFKEAMDQFTKLMYHEQTIPVNVETIKSYQEKYEKYHEKHPNLAKKWSELEEIELMLPSKEKDMHLAEESSEYGEIQPRFAQIEALEELEKTYEEGYKSALVVMATGLGKTYLAGFFGKQFKRVLFIAHREEILTQAQKSFSTIIKKSTFGIYNGNKKEANVDHVFASIFTLSMKQHLEVFKPDDFDLIVIDEFHHAAAASYQRVLDYFQPSFLLGITATPNRNDNKDVYSICDGNVAYRIDFLEAIQRDWLAPFQYYGVYDETDYSQITWLGNRYNEEELLQAQLRDEMAQNILDAWEKHKKTKTLVFCSSIKHARFLSQYFNQNNYNTISLHSKQKDIRRDEAIKQLEQGELDAIFTVDLFNEGVDIPAVDTLLFVRPTESLTVFTQQVGRGLRLHDNKDHCVIIDLIGNYRNADIKLSLFDTSERKGKEITTIPTVPQSCGINLELNVINLLKEMTKKKQPRKEKLLQSYRDLKQELGRRPTYLELHLKGQSESIQYRQEFKSYIGFLNSAEELTEQEKLVFQKYEDWLVEVEKTGMAKSYKMVLLLAMLERGPSDWYKAVTPEEVGPFFHSYLTETNYRKQIDFYDKETKALWDYNELKISRLISKMPMSKWSGSSKGIVIFEDNEFSFALQVDKEEEEVIFDWTKEICEYRLHYHFERKTK